MMNCKCCKKDKDETDFAKDTRIKGGRRLSCRQCVKDKKNEISNMTLRDTKFFISGVKVDIGCCLCGLKSNIPSLFDFHHIDPKSKEFTIANQPANTDGLTMIKEINKCVILCANCHRTVHYYKINDDNMYCELILKFKILTITSEEVPNVEDIRDRWKHEIQIEKNKRTEYESKRGPVRKAINNTADKKADRARAPELQKQDIKAKAGGVNIVQNATPPTYP